MTTRIIWTLNILFLLSLALRGQNSPEPSELVSLRASWQKARDQAVLPIDKKYEEALKSLKDRFTKAGNLEAALHADSELKKITSAKQQSLAQGQQPMSPKSEAAKEKSKLIGEFKNKFGSIFEIRNVTSSGKIAGSFVDPTGVLGDITGEIWEGDINQAQITYLHLKKRVRAVSETGNLLLQLVQPTGEVVATEEEWVRVPEGSFRNARRTR